MAELKDKLVVLESLKDLKDYIVANFTSEDTFNTFVNTTMPKAISDGIAKVVAGADVDFDTLKEIADWIKTHKQSADDMSFKIQKNTNDIAELKNNVDKKLNINQGSSNKGKILGIGSDGNVLPVSVDVTKAYVDERDNEIKSDIAALQDLGLFVKDGIVYDKWEEK